MTIPERHKKYKEKEPFDTINTIREKLTEVNIETTEGGFCYENPGVFCSRITFGDDRLYRYDIGASGKGMTMRYAMASGYAEFMERLQNGILIPRPVNALAYCGEESTLTTEEKQERESCGCALSYLYAPDEVWMKADEISDECREVLAAMLSIPQNMVGAFLDDIFEGKKALFAPFMDVRTDKTVLLPVYFVIMFTGSNGMCAGNTRAEAIIQGLSEIYERYAQFLIFRDNPVIPRIPKELFEKEEIYRKLSILEGFDFQYDILDLSMGKGLPVIGLRLTRPDDGATAFRIGADPSPITALERCLTELFQCNEEDLERKFTKNPCKEYSPKMTEGEMKKFLANFQDISNMGIGLWPSNMHGTLSGTFKGFDHPVTRSNEDDLEYMIGVAEKLGRTVYIRDNSILGFPSFFLLIPGLSEVDYNSFSNNRLEQIRLEYRFENRITEIINILDADEKTLEELRSVIISYYQINEVNAVPVSHWIPPGCSLDKVFTDPMELTKYVSGSRRYREHVKKRAEGHSASCPDCSCCNFKNQCSLKVFARIAHDLQEKAMHSSITDNTISEE